MYHAVLSLHMVSVTIFSSGPEDESAVPGNVTPESYASCSHAPRSQDDDVMSDVESVPSTAPYSNEKEPPLPKETKVKVAAKGKRTRAGRDQQDIVGNAVLQLIEQRKQSAKHGYLPVTQMDEDELFLQSLLPRLRQMSQKDKFELEMEMMELFYKKQYKMCPTPFVLRPDKNCTLLH